MKFIKSCFLALIFLIGNDAIDPNKPSLRRLREHRQSDIGATQYAVPDINYDWARAGQDALDVGKDSALISKVKALEENVSKAGKKVLGNRNQRNLQGDANDASTTDIKYDWERVRKDAIDALGKRGFMLEAKAFKDFAKAGKKEFDNNDQSNQRTLHELPGKSGKTKQKPSREFSKSSKVDDNSIPTSRHQGRHALLDVSGKATKGKRSKMFS